MKVMKWLFKWYIQIILIIVLIPIIFFVLFPNASSENIGKLMALLIAGVLLNRFLWNKGKQKSKK